MLDMPSEPCSLTIHTIQLIQHSGSCAASSLGHRPRASSLKRVNLSHVLIHRCCPMTFCFWTISKQLSEEYERIIYPKKATEDTKPVKVKKEAVSNIPFPVIEEVEANLASGDQSLPMGVLGAPSKRFPSNLEVEATPRASSTEVNASPLWNLAHVKMEPQESEEGAVAGHSVLGSDVFEEPMSGMSEAGIPQSPENSNSSYGSHSTDSLMGSSPVFNQRCKKRIRKI